jgi:hypothetical protein
VKIGICEEKVAQGHEEIKVGVEWEEMEYKKRGRKRESNKGCGEEQPPYQIQ